MSLPFENHDSFTYGSYLTVPELLTLQQCVSVDAKTGELPGTGVSTGQHQLQSNCAFENNVPRFVNDPHATPTEHSRDFIAGHIDRRPL